MLRLTVFAALFFTLLFAACCFSGCFKKRAETPDSLYMHTMPKEVFIENAVTIRDVDTVNCGGYSFCFSPGPVTAFSPTYPNRQLRDSIARLNLNLYQKQSLLETVLSKNPANHFHADSATLHLTLETGTLKLPRWDTVDERFRVFAAFLPHENYFALIARDDGRDYWTLVSRKTGAVKTMEGEPIFSPDGKCIVAASANVSGAHFNGLSLLTISGDTLLKQCFFEIKNWEPAQIRWISNSELIIRKLTAGVGEADSAKDFIKLTIKKK